MITWNSDKYRGRWFELEELYKPNNIKMTSTLKQHLISAGLTFVSVFLVTIAFAVANTSFTFSKEALLSLAVSAIIAGVRGVAKLIIECYTATKV